MGSYDWDFSIVASYFPALFAGFGITFLVSFVAVVFGSALGLVFCVGRINRVFGLNVLAAGFIEFFLAAPILVLLVLAYFGMPAIGVRMSPFVCSVIVLSLSFSAFAAELFRGSFQSFDWDQHRVAVANGMTKKQSYQLIVLPQMLRFSLPPFITLCVDTIKYSTLCSIITLPEILYRANLVIAQTYRPLETYTLVGLVFVSMLTPLLIFARLLERNMLSKR